MAQLNLSRSLKLALVLFAASCGDGEGGNMVVEVDYLSTRTTTIGGDILITGNVIECNGSPSARAFADGLEVIPASPVVLFTWDSPAPTEGKLFELRIAPSSIPPRIFGLPVKFDLQLEIDCGDGPVVSDPFVIKYLPVQQRYPVSFSTSRFWPGDSVGEFYSCEGSDLVLYSAQSEELYRLSLGFSCVEGRMIGRPLERRHLVSEGQGIAAIEPESDLQQASVLWTRSLAIAGSSVSPGFAPVIVIDTGIGRQMVALGTENGLNLFVPRDVADVVFGDPARVQIPTGDTSTTSLNDGDILILEALRDTQQATLKYFIHRFSAEGVDRGVLEVLSYPWNARSYVAEFSADARAIYVSNGPDADHMALEKRSSEDASVIWSLRSEPELTTDDSENYSISLGESEGRLLAVSTESFIWLDPDDGKKLSLGFSPASSNRFAGGTVAADGSVMMIADAVGSIAQGIYVFSPEGPPSVEIHSAELLFRWLVRGWGDEVLVGYYDDILQLHSHADYMELVGR